MSHHECLVYICLYDDPAIGSRRCSECGQSLTPKYHYCPKCGGKLVAEVLVDKNGVEIGERKELYF